MSTLQTPPPSAADPFAPLDPGPPPPSRPALNLSPRQIGVLVVVLFGFLLLCGGTWFVTRCVLGSDCGPIGGDGGRGTPSVSARDCLDVNNVKIACSEPVTLTVGVNSAPYVFTVQGESPTNGQWPYYGDNPELASWVRGTVVNYVFGLAYSDDNKALFDTFGSEGIGDTITLTMEDGSMNIYRFSAYIEVTPDESQEKIFSQREPRVTLVLLGNANTADKKGVLVGTWIDTLPGASRANSGLPGIGTPAVLENDAQVIALAATYRRDPALGLPEGNGYFFVDFTLVYTAGQVYSNVNALNSQLIEATLIDTEGNTYFPSTTAAPYGRYPQPVGALLPSETITGTFGYLVSNLPGRAVTWRVRLRPQDGDERLLSFELPFDARPVGILSREQAVVTVTSVELAPDGSSVVLNGQVGNPSPEPLTILADDVILSAGVAQSPLISADPVFPWTVPSGTQIQFRLTFLKPPTSSALFTLLGRNFALNNIP